MLKKKWLNLRLAVFFAISLCFGIISAFFFKFNDVTLGVVAITVFVAFLALFFILFFEKGKKTINSIFIVLFALFFLLGAFMFSYQTERYEKANLDNHYFGVSGKVIETGKTDTGISLVLDEVHVSGYLDGKLDYKVTVYVKGDKELDIGDKISFNAVLKDKSLIFENSFSPYDIANGIKYTAFITAEDLEIDGKSLNVFEKCNVFIRDSLYQGLDYDEFTVAYAMLTGNSELMDYDVITAYRYMGVAHIFAVSGLHIGFLAVAFNFLFNKLKMKRILKAFVITAILVFYSGVCGFTASSIRATVMSSIMLFLSVKGERYDGLSAVSLAGIIVLLLSPVQLFCVGFQLSFVVVISVLLLAKPIERSLSRICKRVPKKMASSVGVVVSAQLGGIPISLSAFGYFSPISVIANFLLIPVVGIIFYFLIVCTLIGGLFFISHVTLFVLNYVLKFINLLITAVDSRALLITGITFGAFSIFYYIAMIIPSGIFNIKFRTKLVSFIVTALIFITGTVTVNVMDRKNAKLHVCGSETSSMTVISDKHENVMIISDVEKIFSLGNLKRLSSKKGINKVDSVVILNGFNFDMQVLVSRLSQILDLENIYYYGEKDVKLEQVMKKSFKNLRVFALNENQPILQGGFSCRYLQNGIAVELNVKGKRIVVVSTPDSVEDYRQIEKNADILIAGHSLEQFENLLAPKKIISYRKASGYDDGESNGNYSMLFK
ncbi:MAG: ComEC/Rec2 family competence protein [Clostridia bacterium]|nr:ComEC/Rec2 family competence protein [Clostridia bacterium]